MISITPMATAGNPVTIDHLAGTPTKIPGKWDLEEIVLEDLREDVQEDPQEDVLGAIIEGLLEDGPPIVLRSSTATIGTDSENSTCSTSTTTPSCHHHCREKTGGPPRRRRCNRFRRRRPAAAVSPSPGRRHPSFVLRIAPPPPTQFRGGLCHEMFDIFLLIHSPLVQAARLIFDPAVK
jgi:hypothetical protein